MDIVVFDSGRTLKDIKNDVSRDWITASDVQYKWEELAQTYFSFALDPRVDSFSMGRTAGSLAIYRVMLGFGTHQPNVELFNLASDPIGSFLVTHKCQRMYHHVLLNDNIAIVCDDGCGYIYSDSVELKRFVVCRDEYVMDAAFCEEGCACVTSNGKLIWVNGFAHAEVIHSYECIGKPEFIGVIPPARAPTGRATVIMVTSEGALIVATKGGSYQVDFEVPLIGAAISPSGKQVALINDRFEVTVTEPTFSKVLYTSELPQDMLFDFQGISWVGESVPIVGFDGAVILASADNSGCMWVISDKPVLFAELNSAVILTCQASYRISVVPSELTNIFEESEGSKLAQCFSDRLEEPAIEILGALKMGEAIDECLAAAKFLPKRDQQVFFLDVANFGNSFAGSIYHEKIERAIYEVKILNALRNKCRIWMTYEQLESVNLDTLIRTLCNQHHHHIAEQIANLFDYPVDIIGRSYVNYILDGIQDDDLCWDKLEACHFVDFTEAALCAYRKERTRLQLRFLERGDSFSRKAVIYAERHLWEKAFEFAELALDGSTLFSVVSKAVADPGSDLFMYGSESCLYFCIDWPSLVDNERLTQILHQSNGVVTHAHCRFGVRRTDPPMMLDSISKSSVLKAMKHISAEADETGDSSLLGQPINSVILEYDRKSQDAKIKQLAKKSGIDMQRTYILRLREYARTKSWTKFMGLATSKDCNNLWGLCVDLCYAFGGEGQAAVLIRELEQIAPKWVASNRESFGPDLVPTRPSYCKLFR